MFYTSVSLIIIFVYILFDLNYVLRTCFTVLSGRFFQKRFRLCDVTTIYGLGTFQDCDVHLKSIRMDRLLREIDFARFHFYDRTGILHRSRKLGLRSLQGSTLTLSIVPVPLFVAYKINTKLIYFDERSLFLEHEVLTLHDNKVRCFLVSRQFAIGSHKETTTSLLQGLPGSNLFKMCPESVKIWLQSMLTSSSKLRVEIAA